MAVSISLSITQNSQSIANNTSNVTVKVTAKWTYGSFNRNDPSGSCTINGTKYTFTSDFNASQTTSGSQTIFSKTLNIAHGSDGKKTLSCSASYATGVSSGTVTASASKTLTTIPRKSTMSVGNGTLGTAQTLTVTRKSTSFTHTIVATCGSASTTICTKSTSTSISFTPPIAWSSQNTTGTSVSVKYTITTYSGSTSVGSNSYTVSCAIPASVKPSCSLTVSDPTGYLSTYGGYVQGLSKFTVSVSASGSYSSSIKSYRTTANGGTYTASSFTTGAITSSGTLSVSTTVTDSRSRTATASKSVSVLAYASPKISAFSVTRCNQDGTANTGGSYMKVTFNSSVTSLSSKNKATYVLKYKKASEASYTSVTLSDYANNYAVSGGSYIFAADSASSYNVTLTLSDNFKSVSSSGTGATASKTISLYNQGKGIAFGKVAETADVLDSQWKIKEQGKLLSDKYTKYINLYAGNVQNDYCYTVIGLCKTSAVNTSVDSFTAGRFSFHRVNGLTGAVIVDVAFECQYSGANAINAKVNQYGYTKKGVEPCTFTYNGVVYGGLKVFFDAAGLKSVTFSGASNFDIFALDYYSTSSGVINSEIYNSLKTITPSGRNYLSGETISQGDMYFPNGEMIYGTNTSGTVIESFCACSAANNTTMGYGSYSTQIGISKVFGNSIEFYSNGNITNMAGVLVIGNGSGTGGLVNSQVNMGTGKASDGSRYYFNNNGTGRFNTLKYTSSSAYSSRRYKNSIDYKDSDYWHEALMKMKPCTFYYNNDEKTEHLGLIAEDLVELIPELVGIDEEGKPSSIEYGNITIPLIGEVQRLNNVIEEQQKEIDSLKEEMQQLKELVAKLVS